MKHSWKLQNFGLQFPYYLKKVSETKDFKYIQQASNILKILAEKEKMAMEILATI